MPVFDEKQEELEHYETMMGVPRGRLAVTMDMITDAMALVGQHGVYCQSQRWPGKPVLDIQLVMKGLTDAKELIQSVMAELSKQAAKKRLTFSSLGPTASASLVLVRQLLIEKLRHQFQTFLCLRQLEVIPERVRQGLEHNQLRIVPGAQQRAMEQRRIAEQQIAGAGDQQGRGHSFKVGEQRRQHRVLAIGGARIRIVGSALGVARLQLAGEPVQRENLPRVAGAAEVGQHREKRQAPREAAVPAA